MIGHASVVGGIGDGTEFLRVAFDFSVTLDTTESPKSPSNFDNGHACNNTPLYAPVRIADNRILRARRPCDLVTRITQSRPDAYNLGLSMIYQF